MRWRSDAALAAVTMVGVLAVNAAAGGPLTYEWTMSLSLAAFLSLLLFARRRWPLAVLLLSVWATVSFRIADLTGTGWVWPASAAFFTVAATRKHGMLWAAGIAAFPLAFGLSWQPELGSNGPVALGIEVLWLALVLAGAGAYRNWRGWQAETVARVAQLERERDLRAQTNAAQERLMMAQELHDVVAHTLTVVGVQLRVVDEALDDSPDEARAALQVAQEVRGKAVTDLRSLIDVLRERQPLSPQGDLSGIEALVSGTPGVEFELDGDPDTVPAPVALATYRIVQEALTNVVRHAGASRIAVTVRLRPERVSVEVTDDGHGKAEGLEGHGIAGMRERVAALGGSFTAGPRPEGGFRVSAEIPVRQ